MILVYSQNWVNMSYFKHIWQQVSNADNYGEMEQIKLHNVEIL